MTVAVAGIPAMTAELHVPRRGSWQCRVTFLDGPLPSGIVDVTLGALTLTGTVDPDRSGQALSEYAVSVVGGYGWRTSIAERGYHNDAGVKGQTVAADAASDAGETIGTFVGVERLGPDFSREAGPAARALNAATRGEWWIDYAGTTQTGPRPSSAVDLPVLDYLPADRRAKLAIDDAADVTPGQTLTDDRFGTAVIDSISVTITAAGVECWVRLVASTAQRSLADLVAGIVRGIIAERLDGVYRYRVVEVAADGRYDVQSVNTTLGLPDLSKLSAWSASGYHSEAVLGSEVLIAFIDGSRAEPVVLGFPGKAEDDHVPTLVEIAGGADFVALAAKVDQGFSDVTTWLNNTAVWNTPVGPTAPAPVSPLTQPATVAATLVKAT